MTYDTCVSIKTLCTCVIADIRKEAGLGPPLISGGPHVLPSNVLIFELACARCIGVFLYIAGGTRGPHAGHEGAWRFIARSLTGSSIVLRIGAR